MTDGSKSEISGSEKYIMPQDDQDDVLTDLLDELYILTSAWDLHRRNWMEGRVWKDAKHIKKALVGLCSEIISLDRGSL